ncbi:MAG TPA: HAD-IC family P-type ATPase, partial [Clostridia bacterium]|nr:HAD-IC family P-type ATPase [Clostridia bacterium]
FKAVAGRGVEGYLDGILYSAGNEKFLNGKGVATKPVAELSRRFSEEGKTPLYFAKGDSLLGIIAVADVLKATSKQAVDKFKEMGVRVVMLTGDNQRTAEAVRARLGIDEVIAEVLPQEKDQKIRELQHEGQKVAMIGDGVNDAPALARADAGIAIGAGTDVAIEAADIVLVKNDLMDAVGAMELSKATIRNIKQNLFWAFFYNVLGIPVAAGVLFPAFGIKLTPMIGAAAMSLSSFFVVSNALRLRKFRPTGVKAPVEEAGVKASVEEATEVLEQRDSEGEKMEKVLKIKGMMCNHCKAHVEKALNALGDVDVEVDLENHSARVSSSEDLADSVLKQAVEEAGYEVVSIS